MSNEVKTTLMITAETKELLPEDAVQRFAKALVTALGEQFPGVNVDLNIRRLDPKSAGVTTP